MQTKYLTIRPHRIWKNIDGRTASIFGAAPYTGNNEDGAWAIVEAGFTIFNSRSGTCGIGRKPFESKAEGQAWLDEQRKLDLQYQAEMAEIANQAIPKFTAPRYSNRRL